MNDVFISPLNGECVCICGKHTKTEEGMIEHYRKDHYPLWKYTRQHVPSRYEKEWFKP